MEVTDEMGKQRPKGNEDLMRFEEIFQECQRVEAEES
jgi:hypothetical protein